METRLLDAAFQLVSHSAGVQAAQFRWPTTDDARLAELRKQFPNTDTAVLVEALKTASRLEATAIEMADLARGLKNDDSGPALNEQTLSARCPGFSGPSYAGAINDGYLLTRK